jgi:butyryl-CoA dehydrogenase
MGVSLAQDPNAALAGATPYLRLFSLAVGAHYLARAALGASKGPGEPAVALARFFAENVSVAGPGLAASVMAGAPSVLALDPQRLAV